MDSALTQKPADKEAALGALPRWDLADLYPGPGSPELARDLKAAEDGAKSFQASYQGKLAALAGRDSRPGGRGIRAAAGNPRPDHELCRAGLCRRPEQPRESAASSRTCRKRSTPSRPCCCSSPSSSTASKTPRSPTSSRRRNWRITRPGCAICAPSAPISSPTRSRSCCTRNPSPAARPGRGCSTRPGPPCAFPSAARSSPAPRRCISCPTRMAAIRKAAAKSLGDVFGKNARLFAHVTNTLVKDKEIEDRWRGFKHPISSRNLANFVEDEVVDALIASVRASFPSLSHRYYRLKAKWFGVEQMPYWDRNAPLARGRRPAGALERGAAHRARRLPRLLARHGGCRASASSTIAGSTRRRGRARPRAPSPIPPCRARIPISCSIIWAAPAT